MSAETKHPIDLNLPLAAEELIPHRRPIRLIDRLIDFETNCGVVESLIRPEYGLCDHAYRLDRSALVDIIAQSFAAVKGYLDLRNNLPIREGLLVEVRQMRISGDASAGDRILARIKTTGSFGNIHMADGTVEVARKVIASGSIKVWVSD